jgi:hypothetical protein
LAVPVSCTRRIQPETLPLNLLTLNLLQLIWDCYVENLTDSLGFAVLNPTYESITYFFLKCFSLSVRLLNEGKNDLY